MVSFKATCIGVLLALLLAFTQTPVSTSDASFETMADKCCPEEHCPESVPIGDSCSTPYCPLLLCISVNVTLPQNFLSLVQAVCIQQFSTKALPQSPDKSIRKTLHEDEIQVFRALPDSEHRCRNSLESECPLPF